MLANVRNYHQEARRKKLAERAYKKANKMERVWEQIRGWSLDFEWVGGPYGFPDGEDMVVKWIKLYISLVEFPVIDRMFMSYYKSGRFTSLWQMGSTDCAQVMKWLLMYVEKFRQKNKESREYNRKRDRKDFYDDFYYGPHFADSLLDSFVKFVNRYEEGAIVTLILLCSVDSHPENTWGSYKWSFSITVDKTEREPYPGLCMLNCNRSDPPP